MSALTANTNIDYAVASALHTFEVRAATRIYKGSAVGKAPNGYVKPFEPGDEFVGIAYEEANNTDGDNGDTDIVNQTTALETEKGLIQCWTEGDFVLTISGVGVGDIGKPVYATTSGDYALTGHPDAFVGRIISKHSANKAWVRLRNFGEVAPNGQGSISLALNGHETFAATGATAGTAHVGAFELKSILGPGFIVNDAENGGIKLAFDATAEVALASVRTTHDILPVDKGLTFEATLVVSDKADSAAVDIDFGVGTALTTNSEANIDHADMVNLACFHMDGNSDDILAQSDNNSTDVPSTDTTVDNDSTTDVPKKFKIIVRPDGSVEFWIDSGSGYTRVLSSTTFAVASSANLAAFVNMEKTSDDTTAEIILSKLRFAGAAVA